MTKTAASAVLDLQQQQQQQLLLLVVLVLVPTWSLALDNSVARTP
jgi:hypothetical protein